jgi:hypothetical protein
MRLAYFVLASTVCLRVFSQYVSEPRIRPEVAAIPEGRVAVIYLAPRYSTAIRMQDAVNSVVLGDPAAFTAEHSEQEPTLVFVKPIVDTPAQSNLHVTTKNGRQTTLLLVSRGESPATVRAPIHVGVRYRLAGPFVIPPAGHPTNLVAETVPLRSDGSPDTDMKTGAKPERSGLDALLERQRSAALPKLYGPKPEVSAPGDDLVKCGVSEVLDSGQKVAVLFSVVNPQKQSIELMPPQIQLGGKVRSGKLIKRSRWATAEQFTISDYRLSARRLAPGQRADGVVVFSRPPYKQSNETLFLQIAESGGVDRPALAPIGFGISVVQSQELSNGSAKRSQ